MASITTFEHLIQTGNFLDSCGNSVAISASVIPKSAIPVSAITSTTIIVANICEILGFQI